MAAVYVHLSSRDIDDKILSVEGIRQTPEDTRNGNAMEMIECPRCKRKNPPDAMYCFVCSCALNDEALKNITVLQNAKEDPDSIIEYGQWLKERKAKKTKEMKISLLFGKRACQ